MKQFVFFQDQRSELNVSDRLKSLAEGYAFSAAGGGSSDGMMSANSLLGQPIGPPPLLGPRGPNNFRKISKTCTNSSASIQL